MKKRSFLAGMLTMALVGGLGFSALAATGQVSFNASALTLNGTQVSAKGENYTLANGQSVPASITYTDEKGGGTTYLPVRRISELLGVETGWDGTTGSVTIKGEAAATPSQPPVTTTPPTDYSDWSKEDEAAYQEFKGVWEVAHNDTFSSVQLLNNHYKNGQDVFSYIVSLGQNTAYKYLTRLTHEVSERYSANVFYFNAGSETTGDVNGRLFVLSSDKIIADYVFRDGLIE